MTVAVVAVSSTPGWALSTAPTPSELVGIAVISWGGAIAFVIGLGNGATNDLF